MIDKRGFSELIFSGLLYGSLGIWAKSLLPLNGLQVAFFTGIIIFSIFLIIGIQKNKFKELKLKTKRKELFILCISHTISTGLFFWAIQLGKLSEVTFIYYTAPIWVLIYSVVFLKEKIKSYTLLSFTLGIVGIFLIINPVGFTSINFGHILVLIASLFYAIIFIYRRKTGKIYSSFFVMLLSHLFLIILFFPSLFWIKSFPDNSLIYIIILALTLFAARFLMFEGMKRIKAHISSLIMLFDPASATLFGYFIFSEVPSMLSSIGIVFILISLATIYSKEK